MESSNSHNNESDVRQYEKQKFLQMHMQIKCDFLLVEQHNRTPITF